MMCGEIYWVDLGVPLGHEPGFRRPALVIQSDSLNESRLGTTLVIPLTTNTALADYRGNVFMSSEDSGLPKDSVALCSQIMVVDKMRLEEVVGRISQVLIDETVDELLCVVGNRTEYGA
ncbi:MAG: type II toxin-antitoxin system PemK/MazF family toxin [Treponemataceae bacterium]|nr:type II toxin-antitoxin system PemK/MazF family toxin [Treponema sp.]MDE6245459.1 type II toxin-antitoxin system PemK/MazF family toxin [Treponemataceae bacterium]